MLVPSLVSNVFDGSRAYVYLWVSKQWRVVYVGQTNDPAGTLGRAAGHVAPGGSLRKRFYETVALPLERADDLVLLSYPMPARAEYQSRASSYRLAVEYLVQAAMWEVRTRVTPTFTVISAVATNARTRDADVGRLAAEIVAAFESAYDTLPTLV